MQVDSNPLQNEEAKYDELLECLIVEATESPEGTL